MPASEKPEFSISLRHSISSLSGAQESDGDPFPEIVTGQLPMAERFGPGLVPLVEKGDDHTGHRRGILPRHDHAGDTWRP
jgi:hypothetical protein